jgi:hypothetical protein
MKNRTKKIAYSLASIGMLFALVGVNLTDFSLPVSASSSLPAYRYTSIPDVQSSSSVSSYALATDKTGATFQGGVFNGTINFAGAGGNDTVTTTSGTAYVTKYESDGTYDWTRTLDTQSGGGYAQVSGLATDASGNVYVAGQFSGGVTFDGPGGSNSQNISGGGTFINKYSSNGTYLWTKTIIPPANGGASAYGIATDASGNIYVAGSFQDTVNFAASDGGTDNQTSTSGHSDSFVTRFSADGSYGWTKVFDNANGDAFPSGIAVDPSGDVYTTGYFDGSLNFAGTSGNDTQTDASGNGSVYVTKYDTSGSYGWTQTLVNNSSSYIGVSGVAADSSGNVYITGDLDGSLNFAGTSGNDTQTDAGGSGDDFLTKFTRTGSYGWTKTFDTSAGNDSAQGQGVATDENGDIYLLSAFYGSVNFAGTSGNDVAPENQSGALTMYNPDGSYAWTRVFDTTNGSAVTSQGVYAGLAADTLGNIYVGSVFTGTVGFDGPGGSDAQTAGGYGSSFLTSYHSFTPNVSSSTVTTAATTAVSTSDPASPSKVQAPDTGFGTNHQGTPIGTVVLGIAGIGLLGAAIRLLRRRWTA